MNERIQQLAAQAGFDKFSMIAFDIKEDLEKFAELLVRECADIAKHDVMNISTYSDAEFVSDRIHQNFGING